MAVKSKNGPRSNFSLLPFEVQYRIISLLQDGATFSTIAADKTIAEAYQSRGMRLVAPAITRLKKSALYREWSEKRLAGQTDAFADRLTSAILRENAAIDTIAEQTKVALLEVVRKCVSGVEDTKEVERLVRSAATLANSAKDNQIAELKRKLDDAKRLREAAEVEWRNREAELLAEIDGWKKRVAEILAGSKQKGGLSEDSLREIETKIGLL